MKTYIYGINKRLDADMQWWNKRRCALCEIRDAGRKRRCGGCPGKGNKPIVLSDQARPSDAKIC